MAIHFTTKAPRRLLSSYKKAVDDGSVQTWSYDQDGDFTHSADRWSNRAWLRPRVIDNKELIFHILAPRESNISSEVYAIFHGRFIESMLAHCDSLFNEGFASSMPEEGDNVGRQ